VTISKMEEAGISSSSRRGKARQGMHVYVELRMANCISKH
jgi:hypothetical protein